MYSIGVGEKCPFKCGNPTSIMFNENGFTIILSLSGLTKGEVESFAKNKIKFSFCKVDPQSAFFCIHIKDFMYTDVAFNINKSGSKAKDLITDKDTFANSITLILVEQTTNVIAKMRMIGASQEFAKTIYKTCVEQEKAGLNNYTANIYEIMNKYDTNTLVKKFEIAKYTSGSDK